MIGRLARRLVPAPLLVVATLLALAGLTAGEAAVPWTASPAAAVAQAPAQVALPGDDFTIDDLGRLSMVPERMWGVSGQTPAATQTPSLDVLVWDFAQIGNRMFVGGAFLNVQESKNSTPIRQPYVAAFDVDTGDWIDTWRPSIDRAVYSLDVHPSGALLVGGEFETVNGVTRRGVVALDPQTGAIHPSFPAAVDRPWSTNRAMVRELQVEGDDVYVVGNFSHLDGKDGSRRRVYKAGRFSSDGVIDTEWRPEVAGSGVWGMDIDPIRSEVHLAGYFTSVNGEAGTGHFHTVDDRTGATVAGKIELPRNYPPAQPEMFDVTQGDGRVFVIGEQHIVQVLDPADHRMLGYHTTGQRADAFNWTGGFAGGAYQFGERIGEVVFAGCHCTYSTREINGTTWVNHYSSFDGERTPHRVVMAYEASTGELIDGFMADIHSPRDGSWAAAVDTNKCVYIGGDMHVGGVDHGQARWLGGFGKFCPTGGGENPAGGSILAGGGEWRYDDSGADLGTAWADPAYDDGPWATGAAELGFGDGDEATEIESGRVTYYFRRSFQHDGADTPRSLRVSLKADDGAVVYLNGVEIVRDNMPEGTITASTQAPTWRGGADEDFHEFLVAPDRLVDGTNVVAVEVHNVWSGNADLGFDLAIDGSDETPPAPDTSELVALGSTWEFAHSGGGAPANWTAGLVDGVGQGRGSGPAELGFGDGEATALEAGQEAYYFTRTFDLADPAGVNGLTLRMLADDGAVVYLNGTEVVRYNMPEGPVAFDTRPIQWVGNADEIYRDYAFPADALVPGTNVLAVEVHNYWPGNPDLSFDASLTRNG